MLEKGEKRYRQKIISYKVKCIGYDKDDIEYDIPLPEAVYSYIDQALYDWEMEQE